MIKLALLLAALLLPIAVGGAVTYGNTAQVVTSGYVTIGTGNTFAGFKTGISACNGFNDTFGTYRTTQAAESRSMLGTMGMPCALSLAGTYDFKIVLGAPSVAPGQSYFTYARIVDCTGATRIYTTASATSTIDGTSRIWTWGSGSSVVFPTGTCTQTPLLLILFR